MAKKKKKSTKKQMDEIVGVAVSVAPVVKEREKYGLGGLASKLAKAMRKKVGDALFDEENARKAGKDTLDDLSETIDSLIRDKNLKPVEYQAIRDELINDIKNKTIGDWSDAVGDTRFMNNSGAFDSELVDNFLERELYDMYPQFKELDKKFTPLPVMGGKLETDRLINFAEGSLFSKRQKLIDNTYKKHSKSKQIKDLEKKITKAEETYRKEINKGVIPGDQQDFPGINVARIEFEEAKWAAENQLDDLLRSLMSISDRKKYDELTELITSNKEKVSLQEYGLENKVPFAEGGDVDAQMAMLMPTEEKPMMEEQEQDMMPDEQMEDDYLDFIIDQSLSPEEETILMTRLEADPELSVMFDKVMDTAMEFAGSGPVDGPGSGVSDSIPARLSDGEFVFTAKATEQIGADRLQSMMEDAEAEADAMRQDMQMGGKIEEEPKLDRFGKPIDKNIAEDEIKKGMMSVNPRMQ